MLIATEALSYSHEKVPFSSVLRSALTAVALPCSPLSNKALNSVVLLSIFALEEPLLPFDVLLALTIVQVLPDLLQLLFISHAVSEL